MIMKKSKKQKKFSKHESRRFTVRGETTGVELVHIIQSQPPSKRHVVFAGEPRFIRSGMISMVRVVVPAPDPESSSIVEIADDTIPSWEEYVKDKGVRLRFADSTRKQLRIVWPGSSREGVLRGSFFSPRPLEIGERYWIEVLPRVIGNVIGNGPLGEPRVECVTYSDLCFRREKKSDA